MRLWATANYCRAGIKSLRGTDGDLDLDFQILAQIGLIPYILACHLQIDADLDLVLDPAYHFDADQNPDFYLVRI